MREPLLEPIELKIGTELGETYPKNISKVVAGQMLIFAFLRALLLENVLNFRRFEWFPKRHRPRAPNCTYVPSVAVKLGS